MTVNPSQFTCCCCGGTFTKARSDKEAMAETCANFGPVKQEECGVLCEDCYKQFMFWLVKTQRNQ